MMRKAGVRNPPLEIETSRVLLNIYIPCFLRFLGVCEGEAGCVCEVALFRLGGISQQTLLLNPECCAQKCHGQFLGSADRQEYTLVQAPVTTHANAPTDVIEGRRLSGPGDATVACRVG
jgi:hypothetical protein